MTQGCDGLIPIGAETVESAADEEEAAPLTQRCTGVRVIANFAEIDPTQTYQLAPEKLPNSMTAMRRELTHLSQGRESDATTVS